MRITKKSAGIVIFWTAVVLLLFVGIRERSLWTDEWYAFKYFDFSFIDFIKEYWRNPDNHPPGYYLILMAFVKLFGRHDIVLRLPSVIGGLLALFMTWRLALLARKDDERWPYLATLLAASAPFLVILSQTARFFTLSAAAALFAIYTLIIWMQSRERRWLVYHALGFAFMGYLDYPTAIYVGLGALLVVVFDAIQTRAWNTAIRWALAMLGALAFLSPLAQIALREAGAEAAYGADVFSGGLLAWLLRFGGYAYAALYGYVSFPWNWEVTIPLIAVATLLGYAAWAGRDHRNVWWNMPMRVIVTMGAVGIVANTILLELLPRYTPPAFPRYVSFALYLWFIVLAYGISWLTVGHRRIRAVAVACLLFVNAWGLFAHFGKQSIDPTLFSGGDRALYTVIAQEAQPGDYIFLNDDFPLVLVNWYRERYFKTVTPLGDIPGATFFDERSGSRIWVIGYGYDDRDGFRAPIVKAQDVVANLGGSARIVEKGYARAVDTRFRAWKERLTGHPTYSHKVGLFLIESAT